MTAVVRPVHRCTCTWSATGRATPSCSAGLLCYGDGDCVWGCEGLLFAGELGVGATASWRHAVQMCCQHAKLLLAACAVATAGHGELVQ